MNNTLRWNDLLIKLRVGRIEEAFDTYTKAISEARADERNKVIEEIDDAISGIGMGGKSQEARGFNLAIDFIVDKLNQLKEGVK